MKNEETGIDCPSCGERGGDSGTWAPLAWVAQSDAAMHKIQGGGSYDPNRPGVYTVAKCCNDCCESGPGNGAAHWETL